MWPNRPLNEITIDENSGGHNARDFFMGAFESDYRVQQVIEDAERKYYADI